MKIKTATLIGAQLDWAVAKCEGVTEHSMGKWKLPILEACTSFQYSPSTHWAQGGPIIEREEICTKRQSPASVGFEWNAWIWTKHIAKGGDSAGGSGPTPLIAAMRCFVASKLGDEVEVPDELA